MSVKDVIKNSFYEKLGGGTGLSMIEISIILVAALLIGIYIFLLYRNTSKSQFYSKDMNVSMAGMPVIVAAIMIAMQSNLIVSLGMVGALSIVRFRNAVKSPLDIMYMFWAISSGIIAGVGLYVLAIVLSIIMTFIVVVLVRFSGAKKTMLLIVKFKGADAKKIIDVVEQKTQALKEKSRYFRNEYTEMIFEVKTNNITELMSELSSIEDIDSINYLTNTGEFR